METLNAFQSRLRKWSILVVATFVAWQSAAGSQPVYQDRNASTEARVEDLFSRLSSDEKIGLLSGTGFTTQPIPRLGVPPLTMVDAGQGVRGGPESMSGPATAFPAGVSMASTWDTDLLRRIGFAIGQEAQNKGSGAQMLLGPAVNIQRSPLGGRNGEYFSEDPYLTARLAVNYIEGMQNSGCVACVKHYIGAFVLHPARRMKITSWSVSKFSEPPRQA